MIKLCKEISLAGYAFTTCLSVATRLVISVWDETRLHYEAFIRRTSRLFLKMSLAESEVPHLNRCFTKLDTWKFQIEILFRWQLSFQMIKNNIILRAPSSNGVIVVSYRQEFKTSQTELESSERKHQTDHTCDVLGTLN